MASGAKIEAYNITKHSKTTKISEIDIHKAFQTQGRTQVFFRGGRRNSYYPAEIKTPRGLKMDLNIPNNSKKQN